MRKKKEEYPNTLEKEPRRKKVKTDSQWTANSIVGYLILLEKYKFVNKALISDIVNDAFKLTEGK